MACQASLHHLSLPPDVAAALYRSIYSGRCVLFDKFTYILERVTPRVHVVYYGCAPLKPGEVACGWIPSIDDPALAMVLTAAVASCIQRTQVRRAKHGDTQYAVLACPELGFTMISAVSQNCSETLIVMARRGEENDNAQPTMHT